jgi:hypothetical protein
MSLSQGAVVRRSRMTRGVLSALCIVAIAACSGGSDDDAASKKAESDTPKESAGEALERQLDYLGDGQYGRQWEELHPAQREFVDKELFINCYNERLGGIDIEDVDVKEIYDEKVDVPGTDLADVDSKAVTVEVTLSGGGETQSSTDTYHEFLVDGAWRWTLPDVEPYKNGECPEN